MFSLEGSILGKVHNFQIIAVVLSPLNVTLFFVKNLIYLTLKL